MTLYHTYDQVRAFGGGKLYAPEERIGKIRCRRCMEWIPDTAIDRALHARQERIGLRFLKVSGEHRLMEQSPRGPDHE